MPVITDKFGKASISSDVAIATTVKTTRAPGVAVLEAIDLSKYAPDTPVFVVTYRKTTDPVTSVVTISQLRSWKALVNVGANTLTNLTIQPGYADDIGHAVGDFIECIPTSAWENSLIDGILTSLNPDGTLKTAAVQSALGISNTPAVGWNIMAQALTYVSNDGYGQFSGTFNGDVTGFLKEGHKLLVPRVTAPGTQCMNFTPASSQSASRLSASLTNINFTNVFSVIAKINPNSYPSATGIAQSTRTIIARRPAAGSTGWGLRITTEGVLEVYWANGTAFAVVGIQQCPPISEWSSVAISVTASTRTVAFYINSMLIATVVGTSGDTVIGQSGDLSLGAASMLSEGFFDGSMGEVALFNTNLSGAQIAGYANQGLTGAEANCVGLWRGNGNFNDLTTNANNLTANGGAIATFADNPFNAIEYFYVTQVGAYSAGVTPVKLFGGTKGTLPNQTVGVINYSNAATPFGFPAERGAWRYKILGRMAQVQYSSVYGGTPSNTVMYDMFRGKIMANVGKWKVSYDEYCISTHTAAPYAVITTILTPMAHGTTKPTPMNMGWTSWGGQAGHRFLRSISNGSNSSSQFDTNNSMLDVPVSISAQQQLYLLSNTGAGTPGDLYHNGIQSHTEVYFEIAYP